jgi:hypothetical protein
MCQSDLHDFAQKLLRKLAPLVGEVVSNDELALLSSGWWLTPKRHVCFPSLTLTAIPRLTGHLCPLPFGPVKAGTGLMSTL